MMHKVIYILILNIFKLFVCLMYSIRAYKNNEFNFIEINLKINNYYIVYFIVNFLNYVYTHMILNRKF